jgi:hypothetical protein
VNELQGEKIDIVSWDEEPKNFITNALSPSEPVHVELFEQEQTAIVVVPDRQLSLAIGKEGQNTRLAARLTGWRLDIKGMTEWEEIKESTQSKAGAAVADDSDSAVVEATDAEEAVEEAIAIVEEAGAIAAEEAAAGEHVPAESPVAEAEVEAPVETADEDSILEALIREGVHGLIMLGTIGENCSLSLDEKVRVLEAAVEVADGRVPVLNGVAEFTTQNACDTAQAAEAAGVNGLMVMPGMVYNSDGRETVHHFRSVAASTGLPIMCYNNPKVNIKIKEVCFNWKA